MGDVWKRLAAWFARKKRQGLVDVKFYPGDRRDRPLRHAAEEVIRDSDKHVDITEDPL